MAAITPVTATPPAEGVEPWYGPRTTFDDQLKSTANAAAAKADAVETALPAKLDASQKGAASGVASLGADSKLLTAQLPAIAVSDYLQASANQAAMLAKVGEKGDWTIRQDLGTVWIITGDTPTQLASWTELGYPTAPVTTVNGEAGVVVLSAADVGALALADFTAYQTAAATQFGNLEDVVATKAAAADLDGTHATAVEALDLAATKVATADVAAVGNVGWVRGVVVEAGAPDPTGLPDGTLVIRLPVA